ncbi:MAG: hypothetical protein KBT48_07255, partial [Firmicutes bacterium]|nr:hypothetical protein [Bacillota bacterium]
MINKRMIQLLKLSLSISMLHSIFCPLPIFAQEEEPIEQQEESQEDNTIEEINILDVQLLQSEESTSIQVLLDQEVDIQQIVLLVQGNNTLYTINHPNQEGCYYTFTIELDSGEYRAEYLKIGETTLFFEEPLSFTIEQEEEIEVQNSYYGQYDGFDYTGQTTDPDRLKVLQKGKDIISFCWTAPFDMPTWKDEYGDPSMCTDINGYTSWQFEAGHTYSGLPYTLNATGRQYDDIKWKKLLDSGNYTYSTFSGNYSFSGGITVTDTSIKGTDCSAFVSTCLNEVAPTPFYFSTYRMLHDSSFVKVTGFTREERFKNLQPADVLVNDSHAMLYVGRDEDG